MGSHDFQQSVSSCRGALEKKTVLENLDLVLLAMDETIDGGYAAHSLSCNHTTNTEWVIATDLLALCMIGLDNQVSLQQSSRDDVDHCDSAGSSWKQTPAPLPIAWRCEAQIQICRSQNRCKLFAMHLYTSMAYRCWAQCFVAGGISLCRRRWRPLRSRLRGPC